VSIYNAKGKRCQEKIKYCENKIKMSGDITLQRKDLIIAYFYGKGKYAKKA